MAFSDPLIFKVAPTVTGGNDATYTRVAGFDKAGEVTLKYADTNYANGLDQPIYLNCKRSVDKAGIVSGLARLDWYQNNPIAGQPDVANSAWISFRYNPVAGLTNMQNTFVHLMGLFGVAGNSTTSVVAKVLDGTF